MTRIVSLATMIAVWIAVSHGADARIFPPPGEVLAILHAEAKSGALLLNIGATLARVAAGFTLALLCGAALGFAMGRSRLTNEIADPWLIMLLHLPALVLIVLAYIWIGLNETAAILAVALNKVPNTAVVVREGARALDRELDEMAHLFRFTPIRRFRHVIMPQLGPYISAAARSGLSLTWKIVLVVELLGRPNGVGFEIGVAFQLFDVGRILAYAAAFIAIMLLIETFIMQPAERHAVKWR